MKTTLVNLKGGAKLLFNRQTEVNGISVLFSFDAGAINDPIGKLGVAHFCEHALCDFPNAKMNRQERYSYRKKYQYFNASTSKINIKFYIRTIDKNLEDAFDFLTESFASIKLNQDEYETEQNIIRDEITTRKQLNEFLLYTTFNTEVINNEKSNNCNASPAGSIESFNKITIEDLKDFMDKYITLNNLTIAVVGNTTLSKVKNLIKKYVEPRIKISNVKGDTQKNLEFFEPCFHYKHALEEGKAIVDLYYPIKKLPFIQKTYREEYASCLVAMVMQEVSHNFFRMNKKLCYSTSFGFFRDCDHLVNEIVIPCSEENLDQIIDLFEEFIKSLPENLSKEMFEKHKEKFLGGYDFDFITLDRCANSCLSVYNNELKLYSTKTKNENKATYESVTYEEANEIYKLLFNVKPHIIIIANDEKYKDYNYEQFKVTK